MQRPRIHIVFVLTQRIIFYVSRNSRMITSNNILFYLHLSIVGALFFLHSFYMYQLLGYSFLLLLFSIPEHLRSMPESTFSIAIPNMKKGLDWNYPNDPSHFQIMIWMVSKISTWWNFSANTIFILAYATYCFHGANPKCAISHLFS